jgi:exopolysaccharide biosynthesis polyprenyl glycosylphosphotransferase
MTVSPGHCGLTDRGRAKKEHGRMAKPGPPLATASSRADVAPRRVEGPSPFQQPGRLARRRDATRHGLFSILSAITLFAIDAVGLLFAFISAYNLRDLTGTLGPITPPPRGTYLLLVGLASGTILVVFALGGMYRQRRTISRMDEFYRIVSQVSLGLVIAIAIASLALGEEFIYSRQMLAYGWIFAVVVVTTGRMLHAATIGRLRARGVATDRLLIVGAGPTGRLILDKVRRSPQLGFDVVGFVRHAPATETLPEELDGLPILGMSSQLGEIVEAHSVDEIIVALSGTPHEEILDLVYAVTQLPVAIRVYPDSFRLLTSDSLSITDLNGLPTVSVRSIGLRRIDRMVKRTVDIIVSTTVLVLLAPLMLAIALLVKVTSSGPVFFVQERVGQDGRAFQLLKFRSMPVNAEAESGPVWTSHDDPRPTRVGRIIRRYSLDELPQFINVLLGEMSVVGPRPERPFFVEQFRQVIPAYMARHHEKSGVTGWAQANGLRGDTSIEERTRYDLYYVENWSVLFDLKIMVKTLFHIFRHDNNAY